MPLRELTAFLIAVSVTPTAALAEPGPYPGQEPTPSNGPAQAFIARTILVPDLRPRIYVKDLDHLAELVREDAGLAETTRALAARQRTALTVGGVLLVTGVVVSLTAMTQETCDTQPTGFPGTGTVQICRPDGEGRMILGSAISLAGVLAVAIMYPRHGDFLDVINAWNASHPDRPLELFPVLSQVAAPTAP